MRLPSPLLTSALLGVLAWAAPASAQDALAPGDGPDAHNLFPAAYDGDVRDPLTVQRVGGWSGKQGFVGSVFEYGDGYLDYREVNQAGAISNQYELLGNVFAANFSAGYAPIDRLRIFVGAPIYFSTDSDLRGGGGGGFGDLRIGGQVAFITEDGPFQAGFVPWIDVPTGDEARYLGNSGVAGGGAVAGSAEVGPVTFSGDVGMQFDPTSRVSTEGANSVLVGLAVGYSPIEQLGFTAETRLEPSFIEDPEPGTGAPSEVLYTARTKLDNGLHFLAGGGHPITSGPGAAFRGFLGVGWESPKDPQPKDSDGDGIPDKADECRDEPETVNGWRDMDGCPDMLGRLKVRVMLGDKPVEGAQVAVKGPKGTSEHASESVPAFEALPGEVFSASASYAGCYAGKGERKLKPGKNKLQIDLARQEATIKVVVKTPEGEPVSDAKVKWLEPETNQGCHATGEHSVDEKGEYSAVVGTAMHALVVQAEDRAPQRFETGVKVGEEKVIEVTMKAAKTKLEAGRIQILERVFFETGSDVIKDESFALLEEVATVLVANPQIKKVEVQGHTDNKGDDEFNLELSQKRADSVRTWLIEHEVAAERLEAKGFGESQPIASNGSKTGRAKNRRVEFVIVDPAPATEDADKE